jgi:CHAD domain-containing protein
MKKNEEEAYFEGEWKAMKTSLKSFLAEQRQKDLHDFRVQVKKIRAFLLLSDSVLSRPKLSGYFKPVRKVFKQAGEIRNAYITLELGKEYQLPNDEFFASQLMLMENAASAFKSNGGSHAEKLKETHKTLKGKIKPINDVHITLFYNNQLEEISCSLAKLKFDDSLHKCRSQLKVLIYNYKLVHTVLDGGFNEDYLQEVQTAIGDWHDNTLATELILNHHATGKEAVNSLKKQQVKLKKVITGLAKDFYNRATTVVEVPVEQLS